MADPTSLAIAGVPMIIGYTAAVTDQFPSLKGLKPIVALVVTTIVYITFKTLPIEFFSLLFAAGTAMGTFTTAKTLSNGK